MTAAQSLVLGLTMITVFLLVAWLMLSGPTGEAPVSSRGRHRSDGRPQLMLTSVRVERVISAAEVRPGIYEQWMSRRASEAPLFARLAAEMGLGHALGVAA